MSKDNGVVKVGLSEVAQLAKVSEATVSRVINRRQGVSEQTRDRVERAMSELGYGRSNRAKVVGMIVPGFSSPVFAALSEQIEIALAPHGLRAVACPILQGAAQEREFVGLLADLGVSGVVFVSASNTLEAADPDIYRVLESRRIPYACVNGQFEGSDAPTYSSDDVFAGELAVAHLVERGHRRIGIASGPAGNRPADLRVDGFARAFADAGLGDPAPWIVRQSYSLEGGQFAAEQLLDSNVTAIVAASDQMAFGAIRAARRRGLVVPDDVSIIGYDDSPVLEFIDPPLTTIRQPVDRLARHVARSMVALIAQQAVPGGQLLFQPELVIRSSTASPRR